MIIFYNMKLIITGQASPHSSPLKKKKKFAFGNMVIIVFLLFSLHTYLDRYMKNDPI